MNKQVKQIRNEVERLIKWCNAPFTKRAGVSGEEILNNLLSFIDSLEEEPKVDLEKEIDRWWCSQFTDYSMKRVPNHKFIPAPAYIDSNFKQSETGKTKIALELWMDWKVDSDAIEWDSDTIRDFARHFYELGLKTQKGEKTMGLIDKIRAEVEKKTYMEQGFRDEDSEYGYRTCARDILSFLDTIETKDVASIWNDARKTIPEDSSNQIICIKEDDLAVATIGKLVHGTKKWAYLNDLLNISDVKTKDGDVEKELERLDSLLFDLDGIAIAGTTSYLTVEDLKAIAKSFYEMGFNKAKGE